MKVNIVKIGNSHGIRIPKPLLEQTGLSGEVELVVKDGTLIIQHVHSVRANWDEAFADMVSRGDDRLIEGDALQPTTFDEEEWEW
jgi:antitoxin MazE